jgi:hypothetical protein
LAKKAFDWKVRIKETTRKRSRRWKANIKIDLTKIGWGDMDWIDLTQDRDHWKAS